MLTHDNNQRYQIKELTQDHTDQVFQLFKVNFSKQQPLIQAYFKLHPQRQQIQFELLWNENQKEFFKRVLKQEISFGCFDLQNNHQLVGAVLIKDFFLSRAKLIPKSLTYVLNVLEVKNKLFSTVSPNYLQILDSQKILKADQWLFCIKHEHTGKGLLRKMVSASEQLAFIKKYQYSVCWASNFKTGKTMKTLGYELVGQYDATEFESLGICHFKLIRQEHKHQTLWVKKLQQAGNKKSALD